MTLIGCIECNRQISDSARSCPNCSTTEPRGVRCSLCERQMRRFDGIACERMVGSPSSGWTPREEVAHRDCVERHFTPPAGLACPDCRLNLAGVNDSYTARGLWARGRTADNECPRCGASDVFARAASNRGCCGAPHYPFQGEFLIGHGHPRSQPAQANKGCLILVVQLFGVLRSPC